MNAIFRYVRRHGAGASPWNDTAPVREEIFGVERLERHAESLAAAQSVTPTPPSVPSLYTRFNDNAAVLLAAYRASAAELEHGRSVVPAAEWLLDNYHLVQEQIREIRDDLPPGYYRQLPKLADGPFAGYPQGLRPFLGASRPHRQPRGPRIRASVHCRLPEGPAADDRRTMGDRRHTAHRAGRESAPARRSDDRRAEGAQGCRRTG